MNDSYKEILVKRQTPVGMRVLKGALIGLTVLSLVAGLLMWPLLIVGAILIAVDYFVVPKFDVEYEYLYVNGELDIDAIYSMAETEKRDTYDMAELEILAPSDSHAIDSYKNKQVVKINVIQSLDPQGQELFACIQQRKRTGDDPCGAGRFHYQRYPPDRTAQSKFILNLQLTEKANLLEYVFKA